MLLLSSLDDDDDDEVVVVVSSRRKSCLSSSLALALGTRSHALLSVSQNSQTLKFVLLSDDTERLRETERETFRERKVCDVLKTSVVVRKEWRV